MSSFDVVFRAFAMDYLLWVMLYCAVISIVIAVFYWRDPVGCTMHNKYFHKTIAVVFFLAGVSWIDRVWNRGLDLATGNVLKAADILDSEFAVAVAMTVLCFMAGYDYWKNTERKRLHRAGITDEFHVPCEGCQYRIP